ncbi:MAG: class I SAM-dependent methyltransferase [Burkholderiales bacterium]|nr:class I SAM-dependent methyltransferase [Burkholderiales bacterium]
MTTTTVVVEPSSYRRAGHREIEAQWIAVDDCPACGAVGGTVRASIPDSHYVFGKERIPLPESGIPVVCCRICGLAYKSTVPAPAFLAELFGREGEATWADIHDFSTEAAILRHLRGGRAFDLLDVGAADGSLLGACSGNDATGRRSALDVMRYPGIDARLKGEFIEGFLDDASLTWSGEPYDVVTLFDVLEHLYRPRLAFENLQSLLKRGGLAFVETGDAASFWPQHFGISQWWYVRLIEHHVFWSRRSLERIAAAHGFEVISWERRRHKSRSSLVRPSLAVDLLKVGLYCVARDRYAALARAFERHGNQPWCPFTRDHFRACLRKK